MKTLNMFGLHVMIVTILFFSQRSSIYSAQCFFFCFFWNSNFFGARKICFPLKSLNLSSKRSLYLIARRRRKILYFLTFLYNFPFIFQAFLEMSTVIERNFFESGKSEHKFFWVRPIGTQIFWNLFEFNSKKKHCFCSSLTV